MKPVFCFQKAVYLPQKTKTFLVMKFEYLLCLVFKNWESSPALPVVGEWVRPFPSTVVAGTDSLLSHDPKHKAHTNTFIFSKKSIRVIQAIAPGLNLQPFVCGCRSAAAESWRCAFCAVVSISSINFTWTSRHFPTTLCCRHPLCEAGGREAHAAASRAVKEDREARELKTALANNPKEPTPPKNDTFFIKPLFGDEAALGKKMDTGVRVHKRITSFNVTYFEMIKAPCLWSGYATLVDIIQTFQGSRCQSFTFHR